MERFTNRDFPEYTYVPGQQPHPFRSPEGHSYGVSPDVIDVTDRQRIRDEFLWGIDLFNHGYYWEAHEVWEGVWIAFGRKGVNADYLKGLIKLAAAAVKRLEGRPIGTQRHYRRAAELLGNVVGDQLSELIRLAGREQLLAAIESGALELTLRPEL